MDLVQLAAHAWVACYPESVESTFPGPVSTGALAVKAVQWLIDPIIRHPDGLECLVLSVDEQRRRARLPAVVAFSRAAYMTVAQENGNTHRGMIPGGEDKDAYDVAVQAGIDDPEPVWV